MQIYEKEKEKLSCWVFGWNFDPLLSSILIIIIIPNKGLEKNAFIEQPDDFPPKDKALEAIRNYVKENLRNWFKKEKWKRIDTQGNIKGDCGTMPKGKKTQRCLPAAKARSLTKKQRAATSRKKTRSKKQFVKNTKKAKVSLKK